MTAAGIWFLHACGNHDPGGAGRRVATLVEGERSAGPHSIAFSPDNLGSGVYLYRLEAGTYVETRRMSLVK